jgi:hypothetical protein
MNALKGSVATFDWRSMGSFSELPHRNRDAGVNLLGGLGYARPLRERSGTISIRPVFAPLAFEWSPS